MADIYPESKTPNFAPPWSDDELSAAVGAYLWMLKRELGNEPYIKSEVNRQLRSGALAQRTQSSIELRMQNISATLYDMGMPMIAGYVPAKNVGSSVRDRLRGLLEQHGIAEFSMYGFTDDRQLLERRVCRLRETSISKMPIGADRPQKLETVSTVYVRSPAVKGWVLQESGGFCEGCGAEAPFRGSDGLPYLEVHHIVPLSHLGSDTVFNTAALCPNCHRRCHFSGDRDEFKLSLYEKIPRLKIEIPDVEPPNFGFFIKAV